MSWRRELAKLGALFRRRKPVDDLEEEIRSHLTMEEQENLESGMPPEEAHYAALRRFGNVTLAQERSREMWGWHSVETLWQDLRFGLRQLRRSPGFTAVAVLTLALGIGLTTAIFSLVNTVLLRPLPYPHPERIVVFMRTGQGFVDPNASPAKFNAWRQQTEVFQEVSAFRFSIFSLTGGAYTERILCGQVSADFFRLFGASLVVGRTFSEAEDLPGAGHVAVLSNEAWKRRFRGDLHIIGKTISLEGSPYEVIGILGPSFSSPDFLAGWRQGRPPDVWVPFQLEPNSSDDNEYFTVAGRLRPGVTLGMAKAQLQVAAEEFRRRNPRSVTMGPKTSFGVQPMQDFVVERERSTLFLLSGAVGFVLLIACANVANLLLARAAGRKHEFAIRAAIGAGRGRIVRQLLTESGVLAVAGGALGLFLGFAGIHGVLKLGSADIPRTGEYGSAVTMDWRVLFFTLLVSLATAILSGLLPALQGSQGDLSATLKEGGGHLGSGFRQNKGCSLLVVSEMALALILLVGAGLLMRTFVALHSVDSGLDSRNVLTVSTKFNGARFKNATAVAETVGTSLQRISALPGVEATGFTCCLPLEHQLIGFINVVGRQPDSKSSVEVSTVSPDYFRVFKIRVVRGRTFTDHDNSGAAPVVVINQTLARQFWPKGETGEDTLKEQIRLLDIPGLPPRQIVGIVGDVRSSGLDQNPPPIMYIPVAQTPEDLDTYLLRQPVAWIVRTRTNPYLLSLPVQNLLRQATGGLPVLSIRSMDDIIGEFAGGRNFSLVLMTIFACSAMLLAAIGIYGVVAYSVEQRTHELGIRMAMGAQRRDVLRLTLRQGMILALVGVCIGATGALGLTRFLSSLLFGVKPSDPLTFAVVSLVLVGTALPACYIPARRAAKVDPMVALRYE